MQLASYTAANLKYVASPASGIQGAVGWMAAVSDNQGKLAYWNTTSAAWLYVKDDTAV